MSILTLVRFKATVRVPYYNLYTNGYSRDMFGTCYFCVRDMLGIKENLTILVVYGAMLHFEFELEPFWQFLAQEVAISWKFMAPNCTILVMSSSRSKSYLGPEISKMVQFLGPEIAWIWQFLDLMLKYLFFFSTYY